MGFKIKEMFHLIQVTDDFEALDAWYTEIFGAIRFTDGHNGFPYLPVEKRNATLTAAASACLEPISPAFAVEGWESAPIGKFHQKFGPHWYSIAWHVDDTLGLYRSLVENKVRILGQGGAKDEPTSDDPLFTHPKDTVCALEFMSRDARDLRDMPDPRFVDPHYSEIDWPSRTPLGFVDLAYVTVATRDLDRARRVFVDWLDGDLVGESLSALTATRDVYVQVGDILVQISEPLDARGSLIGADVESNGESMHSVAWRVRDLSAAKEFLDGKGVATVDQDEHTLIADPTATFGSYYRFTDASVADLVAG